MRLKKLHIKKEYETQPVTMQYICNVECIHITCTSCF